MNQDKNNLDRFLEGLTTEGNKKIHYEKTYVRPSKLKSVIGFVASLIFLIIMIGLFTLSVMYFVLLIGTVLVLVFFSVNVFTEKGLGLPKTIAYVEEDEEEEEEPIENEEYNEENSSFYDEEAEEEWDDERGQ